MNRDPNGTSPARSSRGAIVALAFASAIVACSGSSSSTSEVGGTSAGGAPSVLGGGGAPSVLGGGGSTSAVGGEGGASPSAGTSGSAGSAGEGGTASSQGGTTGAAGNAAGTSGAAGASTDDGAPMRVPCTGNLGSGLDMAYGRLDGYLVAIVPPGGHACNADSHHVHLQVAMKGGVYDVAVDILSSMQTGTAAEVMFTELDAPLADGAWSEGWHTGIHFDYAKNLGVHAGAFGAMTESQLAATIEARLANVNHVSVFGTGYGPDGMHDIHRKSSGEDGCIVTEPLATPAHYLLFHFSNQTF